MEKRGQKYKLNININNLADPHVMAMNYINPNSVVLDVGCACGDLGVILKQYKNCTLYGLEYNHDSCVIATNTGAYEDVVQFDLDTLTENNFKEYQSKFDYIVCNDILEHLRDPENTIKILKTYLKPNGALIASIPNIAHASIKSNLLLNDFTYTKVGLLDETHIHLFTYKSIVAMLSSAGFLIQDSKFSLLETMGWQPNNPWSNLPNDIKQLILDDWHSYVCQYVVKAVASDEYKTILYNKNLPIIDINEKNAPSYIKEYREQQLSKLILEQDGLQVKQTSNTVLNDAQKIYQSCKIIRLKNRKYFNILLITIICLFLINILLSR